MITSSLFARLLVRPAIFALAVSAATLLPVVHAQIAPPAPPAPPVTAGDAKEYEAANALFNAAAAASPFDEAKWKSALTAFENFRNKYTNQSPKSVSAKYQLGLIYLNLKMNDDAVREFRQLSVDPKLPNERSVKEELQLYIAKALTLRGAALPTDGAVQKGAQVKAFEEAIAEYDKFLTTFPNSATADYAHFLRATLLMANEQFDPAVKGFATILGNAFPQSPYRMPAQLNIGKVRMAQAQTFLAAKEGKDPQPEDVKRASDIFTGQALPALEYVYANSGDLALMNESVSLIGQIQLTRSLLLSGDDPAIKKQQKELLNRALDAYRAVRSREEVVVAQAAKIAAIKQQDSLVNPNDVTNYTRLKEGYKKQIEVAEENKARYETEADQFVSARIAIARIFLIEKSFDECRVLIRYLQGQKDLLEKDKDAQAAIASILTMTYLEQKNIPKGLEAYEAFRKDFKGKPGFDSGDALPLALANALVETPDEANVAKAMEVLDNGMNDYKPWRYESQSIQVRIAIYTRQGNYDEALKAVETVLSGGPKPEVEADGLMAKANLLRAMASEKKLPAKADEAIATLKVIREKFPNSARAEDAWYLIGDILESRSPETVQAAQTELTQFIEKFKNGGGKSENTAKNVVLAQFQVGRILQGQNKFDDALKTYRYLIEKWPESEPAPKTYFKISDIQTERKDYAGVMKTMEEYLQKYPNHEFVYYAYNNIAELLFNGSLTVKPKPVPGKPLPAAASPSVDIEAGAKKLMEYVDYELSKDLKEKRGAETLLKICDRWKRALPNNPYFSLNSEDKLLWQKVMDNILAAGERVLKSYPTSEQVPTALARLVFVQHEMFKAKLVDAAKGEAYFRKLLETFGTTPEAKSKVLLALSSFLQDIDKNKAGVLLKEGIALAGSVKPEGADSGPKPPSASPADWDKYLSNLYDQKQYDQMMGIIEKVRGEYPVTKDEEAEKLGRSVRDARLDAQAVALFWEAKYLGSQNKTTDAGSLYGKLAKEFPKHRKVAEADYGVILGKMDMSPPVLENDFIERLQKIVSNRELSFDIKSKALFLAGRIYEAQKDWATAATTYRSVALNYSKTYPAISGESLWRAAEILEKQANGQIPVKTQKELLLEHQAKAKEKDQSAKEAAAKKAKEAPEKKPEADKAKPKGGETKAADPAKPADKTTAKTEGEKK